MENLWARRTNSSKLSLSTSSSGQNDSSSSGRNASFSKRFDSSSHGKSNPFNSITTPGGGLASPGAGGASSAFGLGSGAFASFGSKTPKSPGNPFDLAPKTPGAEKSAKEAAAPNSTSSTSTSAKEVAGHAAGHASHLSNSSAGHPLRNSWTLWFRPPIPKSNGHIPYEKTVHAVASIDSAEDFFAVYSHLKRPSTLPLVSDYHLFKKGIRPIWEDDENKKGGKWIVRLKKGVADRYWEDLLLAIIGDQFHEAGEEVCGAVVSVRNGEDILSIWTRSNDSAVLKIRDAMKRALNFPPDTKLDFKSHDESIQQRNSIDEARREKNSQHHNDKRVANRQQGEESKQVAPGS